jgi:hypothetical protein
MPVLNFNANQTAWSGNNALECAMAAQPAYKDAATIQATAAAWGFGKSTCFDVADTNGFATGNDEMVLVAFREIDPEDLKNRMTDADVAPLEIRGAS